MGRGIFRKVVAEVGKVGKEAPGQRREGYNRSVERADALLSAYAVFFFQHPSLLQFQRAMKEKRKRDNVETLFGVGKIPSGNEIRQLIDPLEPEKFRGVYDRALKTGEAYGVLDPFRVLDGGVLLALDGVWYHASETIHCKRCLHKESGGKTTYYHTVLAGTPVSPGNGAVLPVMPEMIVNGDGEEKQDCEINAAKRRLAGSGKDYGRLKPTLLGDDLYSHYPFCQAVLEAGYSFIFTCKDESHPWLAETVKNSYVPEKKQRKWNGRNRLEYRWQRLEGVPIRDGKETLEVNYLSLTIGNEEKGKATYRNSWITNKAVNEHTVEHLADCGRARWKIENEHNNVLKNHGYNLKHNFGHGEEHAGEVFCLLNLLSFLLHTILDLSDDDYQIARETTSRRDEFFNLLRAALRFGIHESWEDFLAFVSDTG